MMDYKKFISDKKSFLVAPAGYGKTHTIAASIKHCNGRQLILTHTHAGIASIKEKLRESEIGAERFHVETITGYAQKYVLAFYTGQDIPAQENTSEYYPFIIKVATELLSRKPIADIVSASFSGLFVDEYQDCTISQHKFINELASILPTRILGDHLQGIFDLNSSDPLVDLSVTDQNFTEFAKNKHELIDPWRWRKGRNVPLGEALKSIRRSLESEEPIELGQYACIESHVIKSHELYNPTSDYYKKVSKILKAQEVLLLHPDSCNLNARKKVIGSFKGALHLIEAIDDKDFYRIAKMFDECSCESAELTLRTVAYDLFSKTALGTCFNEKGVKRSSNRDSKLIQEIKHKVQGLKSKLSLCSCCELLKLVAKIPGIRVYRKELYSNICSSLQEAHFENLSVYDVVVRKRNQVRRMGRKLYGSCIGTTLLTKGLEFDTVVILDAHKFTCPKHLYVALTRASTRLVVFSDSLTLNPFKQKECK